jgi:hypothetical protein
MLVRFLSGYSHVLTSEFHGFARRKSINIVKTKTIALTASSLTMNRRAQRIADSGTASLVLSTSHSTGAFVATLGYIWYPSGMNPSAANSCMKLILQSSVNVLRVAQIKTFPVWFSTRNVVSSCGNLNWKERLQDAHVFIDIDGRLLWL